MNNCYSQLRQFAALLTLLISFSATAEELNSERIERLFGSYGVDIVHQSDGRRVSCLRSTDDGITTCRTLAIVSFADPLPEALSEPHAAILAGSSIGSTLKGNGWEVSKLNLYIGALQVPGEARDLAGRMAIEVPIVLPMHAYRLSAVRGDSRLDYATIIEVHHPALHSVESLHEVYGELPTAAADEADRAHFRQLALAAVTR